MAAQPERLCDEDFHTWTRDQARALRRLAATRPNIALDFEHLIEEVADLGKSERFAVRGQLRRIIEHSLKLAWSLASEPRPGWHETIIDARTTLDDKLSPTLRRDRRRKLNHCTARRDGIPRALSALTTSTRGRRTARRVPLPLCRPAAPRLVSRERPRPERGTLRLAGEDKPV
jgi:hypothetical protein